MYSNNSPLEHLAAFAIVFVVAVISTVSLGQYIGKAKCDVKESSLHS